MQAPASYSDGKSELMRLRADAARLRAKLVEHKQGDARAQKDTEAREIALAIARRDRRITFLKAWLHDHPDRAERSSVVHEYISPSKIAGDLRARVGHLDKVYRAVIRMMDEDTNESWSHLEEVLTKARARIGEPFGEPDADPTFT